MKIPARTLLVTAIASMPPAMALDTPPFSSVLEARITVNADLTATLENILRHTVLKEGAIRTLGQLTIPFSDSIDSLEIVEAFTEKADGRKLMLGPENILTRDAASGLNAIYQRDARVKTLIYPDVQVGDTVAYHSRIHRHDSRIPGHVHFAILLARSVPFRAYHLTVDAPASLDLGVQVSGDGLTSTSADAGDLRHYEINYEPQAWNQAEVGAISAWDRDPQVVISNFKSTAELGAGYWAAIQGKDVITPEIAALADDITRGIADKRGQARAIDHWVKQNIRYVLVYLGAGGLAPNPASSVLQNRYGDCKDHVTLMRALLNAKGIPSEQVLINLGNRYTLARLPLPDFNHIMLYLPDFNLYADPTASRADFGVLPIGSYDKPVLHISDAGGRLLRTPPMKAEDHVTISRTKVTVSADGVVKGETVQTSTGVFATIAREVAAKIQEQGPERYAEALLRSFAHQGTGTFEAASPSDLTEPYDVRGSFVLQDKQPMPLSGARDTPVGMPIIKRPGLWPFGQRIANRQSDFVCFAATQVEEIEITFAPGLPLPDRLPGLVIESRYFTYSSDSRIDGRTLKVHSNFKSALAGQVCASHVEEEIREPLNRVARNHAARMIFSNRAPAPNRP